MKSLLVLSLCCCLSPVYAASEIYLGAGAKVGEISSTSAIVYTRLTFKYTNLV